MTDDPIDLTPLDPNADRAHFDDIMRRLRAAAAPELARRRLSESIWTQVLAWRRPVFAFGLAALLLMVGATQFVSTEESAAQADDLSVALGVPEAVSNWVVADSTLTTAQVLYPGEGQ